MVSLAIITPTYDEAGNIERLLTSLSAVAQSHLDDTFTVLVVDDSSPDGTADIVRSLAPGLQAGNFTVELLVRHEKDGLGRAYLAGFRHVLERPDIDYVLQMDADLSHDPAYLTDFLQHARNGMDLVVASRYVPGGATPDWGWHRQLLSRGGNLYTRALLGSRLTDYTGGFNMYRTSLLQKMDLDAVATAGYGFQIEMKHMALQHTEAVAQVPIVFIDRTQGTSKIPKSTLAQSFGLVLRIWRRDRRDRNR